MSDNAEAGIAQTQAAAAQAKGAAGLEAHHAWNIAYLDERILVFLVAIGLISLLLLWATVTSPLVLYGSLVAVILLTVLWGVTRVKRLEATRQARAQQAQSWRSEEQN